MWLSIQVTVSVKLRLFRYDKMWIINTLVKMSFLNNKINNVTRNVSQKRWVPMLTGGPNHKSNDISGFTQEEWYPHRCTNKLLLLSYALGAITSQPGNGIIIVWTENKNVTISDSFICYILSILTVKQSAALAACVLKVTTKKVVNFFDEKVHLVTRLEDFLTSKWPGSFTALAFAPDDLTYYNFFL